MKANVKSPGLKTTPVTTELNLSYADRYADEEFFDAYTRLILEVIHGRQATFVRDDELKEAWAIFTPLLHRIERERVKPILYDFGGRRPPESDQMLKDRGYYEYHGGEPLLAPVRPCTPLYAPARHCMPLLAPVRPCSPLFAPAPVWCWAYRQWCEERRKAYRAPETGSYLTCAVAQKCDLAAFTATSIRLPELQHPVLFFLMHLGRHLRRPNTRNCPSQREFHQLRR